jgi:hypothetical protein
VVNGGDYTQKDKAHKKHSYDLAIHVFVCSINVQKSLNLRWELPSIDLWHSLKQTANWTQPNLFEGVSKQLSKAFVEMANFTESAFCTMCKLGKNLHHTNRDNSFGKVSYLLLYICI